MTLAEAIRQLVIDADPLVDYELRDDGQGAYIAQWNLPTPRPTTAELAALGVIEGRKTMSAIREWTSLLEQMIADAQAIIDRTATTSRLAAANGLSALIEATPDGEIVGDGSMTKARAQEVNAMFASFQRWLMAPVTGEDGQPDPLAHGKPPIVILSERQ